MCMAHDTHRWTMRRGMVGLGLLEFDWALWSISALNKKKKAIFSTKNIQSNNNNKNVNAHLFE